MERDQAVVPGEVAIPVLGTERIHLIDALRGFALFGVLTANVWLWFSGTFMLFPDYQRELQELSLDSVAYFLIAALISAKFISIFSFLFGLGFSIQLVRASRRGQSVTWLYLRRLAVLAVFGLVHGILIWYGDILLTYSLLGLLLLLFGKRKSKTLLIWAGILLVFVPLVFAGIILFSGGPSGQQVLEQLAAVGGEAREAFANGGWREIIQANLEMLAFFWGGQYFAMLPYVLGLFLLGFLAGRMGVLAEPAKYLSKLRQLRFWVLVIAIPAGGVSLYLQVRFSFLEVLSTPELLSAQQLLMPLAVPTLATVYVTTLILLYQKPKWRRRLQVLTPVGRMALTNYLAQSVICTSLFYGFGLGLMDVAGPALSIAISLVIFSLQVVWSRWWLGRFRFGPMEWLWRSLTYLTLQPMRRWPASAIDAKKTV